MTGFTIGTIVAGDRKDDRDRTDVSIVDDGVYIYHHDPVGFGWGGMGTYTPAQARELGQLLINAADRWAELNAQVKQSRAEIAAVERASAARIKDMLA
jgi:hypothetical protein